MMVTPFEVAILKMRELGMFQFLLPFILFSAIFYGLLRKSQIFGPPERNVAVNAVVALVSSFFVWASPILMGINIETQLAAFFVQALATTLIFIVGVVIAGMFFPEGLGKILAEKWKGGMLPPLLITGIITGGIILVSSGLYMILFPKGVPVEITTDILITFLIIILLIGSVGVIVYVTK